MIGCLNLSSRAELIKLVGCYDVQTVQDGYLNRTQRVLYHNEIVNTHTEESFMSCRSIQDIEPNILELLINVMMSHLYMHILMHHMLLIMMQNHILVV